MRSLRNVLTLMLALTPMAYSQAETEASLSAAYYASEQFMFKYRALGTSEVSHHVTYQCIYDIVPGTETPLFDGAMPLHPEERPMSIEETYLKAIQLKVVLDADFSAADESVSPHEQEFDEALSKRNQMQRRGSYTKANPPT